MRDPAARSILKAQVQGRDGSTTLKACPFLGGQGSEGCGLESRSTERFGKSGGTSRPFVPTEYAKFQCEGRCFSNENDLLPLHPYKIIGKKFGTC